MIFFFYVRNTFSSAKLDSRDSVWRPYRIYDLPFDNSISLEKYTVRSRNTNPKRRTGRRISFEIQSLSFQICYTTICSREISFSIRFVRKYIIHWYLTASRVDETIMFSRPADVLSLTWGRSMEFRQIVFSFFNIGHTSIYVFHVFLTTISVFFESLPAVSDHNTEFFFSR